MFHHKILGMDYFDGKDQIKLTNKILVHFNIRSNGRLLHYNVIVRWDVWGATEF